MTSKQHGSLLILLLLVIACGPDLTTNLIAGVCLGYTFLISTKVDFQLKHDLVPMFKALCFTILGASIFLTQYHLPLFINIFFCLGITFFFPKNQTHTLQNQALLITGLIFIHFQHLSYTRTLVLTLIIPLHLHLLYRIYFSSQLKVYFSWIAKLSSITLSLGLIFYITLPRMDHSETNYVYSEGEVSNKRSTHSLLTKQEDDLISLKGVEKLKMMQEPILEYSYKVTKPPINLGDFIYLKKQSYDLYKDGIWKTNITEATLISDEDDGQKDNWVVVNSNKEDHIEFNITPLLPISSYLSMGQVNSYQTDQLFIRAKDNFSQLDQNQSLPYSFKSEIKTSELTPYPSSGHIPPSRECLTIPFELQKFLRDLSQLSDPAKNNLQKLQFFELYFRTKFQYSLTTKGDGQEPLFDLINGKQGWCVHFATALTLMARELGFPARVVSGLCLLTPKPYPNIDLARLSHSHTWTEVYIEPYGWTLWDATPPAGLPTTTTTQVADIKEDVNLIEELILVFQRELSSQNATSTINLSIFIGLLFITTLIFLISNSQRFSSNSLASELHPDRKPIYTLPSLEGIWEQLNQKLLEHERIQQGEPIKHHISRIKSDYPQIDFEKIEYLHNSSVWGDKKYSEQEMDWLAREIEKINSQDQ